MGFRKFIEKLKEQIMEIDIEEIINLRIQPEYNGKYLCPFHDDHSPNNFSIYKSKNTFKCFACGEKGDGITFIMKYDNVRFPEAILIIARELHLISEKDIKDFKFSKQEVPVKKFIKREIPEKADVDTLDKVYSIFIKGNTLMKKEKLSKEHFQKLKNERQISEEEIEENGYFTFPDKAIMRKFQIELLKNGIDVDVLNKIPGFFFNKKSEEYDFASVNGIGIPIKDVDGKIVGIQIRMDEDGRYRWFSSSFAERKRNLEGGCSPGCPIAVQFPKKLKCKTVFITEGHFKARKITEEFGVITLSVQGVGNWKGIEDILENIQSQYPDLNFIMITFDADMVRNENVKKQAIKIGEALKEKNKIYYCVWKEEYGKGIDDVILNGHKDKLRKLTLEQFLNH